MLIKNVTIGADPELFIINKKTGKVVSSIGLIPGEKGKPYRSKDMPKGYGLEIDNILAEFNIPPAKKEESFVNSINYMKNYIREFVAKKNPDYDILCAASMIVDEDQLQSDEANLFGCSVDYNVYTEKPNPKPNVPTDGLRSAGFHIHIGYSNPNVQTSLALIKYLDYFVGIPSIVADTDTRRRSLYGKAGCFRLCEYGCEYRVLSSYMMSSDELISNVYKNVITAINAFNTGYVIPVPQDVIINTINNSDVKTAKELINASDYPLANDFVVKVDNKKELNDAGVDIALKDIEQLMKDFKERWGIDLG